MPSQTHSPSQVALVKPSSILVAASTSPRKGDGVDCFGFTRALVLLHVLKHDRTDGDETLDVKLQSSVDDVDGDYADVTNATFTQVAAQTVSTTHGVLFLAELNLEESKWSRWIRPVSTLAGTTPGNDTYAITVVLFNPTYAAVAQDNTVRGPF